MNSALNLARQTVTYAAAELDDLDGVKTTFATAATATALTPANYTGALVASSGTAWAKGLPRSVTISRSAATGSYTTDPIVLTGTRDSQPVTESLTPADADGDDTIRGTQLWDAPPSIALPAQVNTSGAITIGCGDIGQRCALDRFAGVKLVANGQLNVQYGERSGAPTDSHAAIAGSVEPIAPTRIRTSAELTSPTTVGLTVYLL